MSRCVWLLVIVALAAVVAFGQEDTARAEVHAGTGVWFVGVGGGSGAEGVTGAPYSAEEIEENVQTLADGTHLTHTSTVKMYRDSQGRTRTERSMPTLGAAKADAPVMIDVFDPVAHVHYMLNTRDKIAHKVNIPSAETGPSSKRVVGQVGPFASAARRPVAASAPPPPRAPDQAADTAGAERPKRTSEKLGTETMEGFQVEGRRITTTWPAGSAMGNDRPITSVDETWFSPELHIVVLSKGTDPRNGEHTRKLVNIDRTEPDPSLFQPPADYTIKENEHEGLAH